MPESKFLISGLAVRVMASYFSVLIQLDQIYVKVCFARKRCYRTSDRIDIFVILKYNMGGMLATWYY